MGKNASYSLKIIKPSFVGKPRRNTCISAFSVFHAFGWFKKYIDNDKKIGPW